MFDSRTKKLFFKMINSKQKEIFVFEHVVASSSYVGCAHPASLSSFLRAPKKSGNKNPKILTTG